MPDGLKMVLLPGLDGTGNLFEDFSKCIDFHCTTISYPSSLEKFEDYVEYLEASIDSDCILVAESFSGPIAAALHNDHIKGICFAATFLTPPRPYLLQLAKFIPEALFNSPPPDFLLQHYMSSRTAVTRVLKDTIRTISPSIIKQRLKLLSKLELPEKVRQVPVLYLMAKEDKLVNKSSAKDFQVYEDCTIKKIKGSHLLLQEEPAKCAEEISKWIEGFS